MEFLAFSFDLVQLWLLQSSGCKPEQKTWAAKESLLDASTLQIGSHCRKWEPPLPVAVA